MTYKNNAGIILKFLTSILMIDYSFFFFNFLKKIEAQQLTQPHKPLATPSQAHWSRANNRYTTLTPIP